MLIKYDYVTLMLINMTGGLVILAWFVLRGLGREDRKHWALARGWDLMPIAVYAVFAGAAAILIGVRVMRLGLTQQPVLSGVGFILTGAAGVLAALMLRLKQSEWLRVFGSILLLAGASIWAWTGYTAYWWHLSMK